MKLNMYQRLRDFSVPNSVLDAIFSVKTDLEILENSWQELETSGLKDDEIAAEVSKLIFKEMGPDQKSPKE
ncbi:MAG: hypothetical protein V3S22_00720 [Candidatus Neomarinimicrobiota bacterium]